MWPRFPDPIHGMIPSYYILTSLAFCVAIFWSVKRAKKNKALKFDVNTILDLALVIIISSFIGARLVHVLYEQPTFYFRHPEMILMFWYGGFVYYGGFFAALLGCYLFWKKRKFDFWKYADLIAPPVAAGYAVGRIGCFLAGCCYGRLTHLPWAVVFPERFSGGLIDAPTSIPLHPTELYCVAWEFMVCFFLLWAELRWRTRKPGLIFALWITLHGLGRAFIEQFRDDFRGQNVFNLSISTWISLGLIVGGVFLMLKTKGSKNVSSPI